LDETINDDAASSDDFSTVYYDVDDGSHAGSDDGSTFFACTSTAHHHVHPRHSTKFDTDAVPVKIDNCASACMTNSLNDFVEPPKRINVPIGGIGGPVQATHKGTLRWTFDDDQGRPHTFLIPNSYYTPDTPYRLLSPQHWAREANDHYPQRHGTFCTTLDDHIELFWQQRRYRRTIPLHPVSRVGTIYTSANFSNAHQFFSAAFPDDDDHTIGLPTVISDDEGNEGDPSPHPSSDPSPDDPFADVPADANTDSTPTPPEFIQFDLSNSSNPNLIEDNDDDELEPLTNPQALWRYWHNKLGHISNSRMVNMARIGELPRILANCRVPICPSCLFGKGTRRAWRSKGTPKQASTRTVTAPGDCVSVDQLESTTPGLVGQLKGTLTNQRYRVMTIFVDHYSDLGYVHAQKSTSAQETVEAKHAFERFAKSHGVQVKHYHADNGRFAEKMFTSDIAQKGQTISFCGVNAHHQNGIAEKRIRDLSDTARTMLIHANRQWPEAISANLWPYAIRMANDVRNATPNTKANIAPLEKFSGTTLKTKLSDFHPFGCPAYVLDSNLQARKKIPKWKERMRVGIYLGHSPVHARSVSLILSMTTGLVSPQFHVTHDDDFETVRKGKTPSSRWQRLAGLVGKSSPTTIAPTIEPVRPPVNGTPTASSQPTQVDEGDQLTTAMDDMPANEGDIPQDEGAPTIPEAAAGTPPTVPPGMQPAIDPNVRRSRRTPQPSRRHLESLESSPAVVAFEAQVVLNALLDDLEIDKGHPLAYAASADPDTMYLDQAMREPDREKFIEAMQKEIKDHEERGHWEVVPRDSLPKGTPILPAVWSMKRKRRLTTREVYKWKARLTIHGGKQQYGVNYWDTYSPVVRWSTIRLFLILASIHGWHTRQLDFVLAYPQAPVECDLYMAIPKGFTINGDRKRFVLKLKKNLYGQKQAGRVWNQYLTTRLTDSGFVQSKVDECLFYFKQCVMMVYVDDTIISGPNKKEVNEVISLLGQLFDVDDQGDLNDFLGVKVEHLEDGRIKFTQPHLIDQILSDLHMTQPGTKSTPTPALLTKNLQPDDDGRPFDDSFHYRSVIGKLNFLEKSTRPDIAYAVHQCARFMENPKMSHGQAVKHIGRYLLGTRDKGLIFDPNPEALFECFADADYCGNWNRSIAMDNIDTARSRTGYLIRFGGCLLLWASRLQTEIALSTTEAEYIALSAALREVIPLIDLCIEAQQHGIPIPKNKPTVYCRIFEDNTGAYELATTPKMRPRTRHINVKYHHFRHYVANKLIDICRIDTTDQLADFLTKQCPINLFRKFRKLVLGW